jgi:hypothetical protein
MRTPFLDPEVFRARFTLEPFADGGVLVDLESGSYFELNGTATEACKSLLATETRREADVRLGEILSIGDEAARSLIDSILEELAGLPRASTELVGPFRYLRDGDVYVLEDEGRPILEVDPHGGHLGLRPSATSLRFPMLEYVRAVTPKLLGLSGITVLHASACHWAGRTIAFSGPSGAGKTTTMRAFVDGGAAAISQDLVVLSAEPSAPRCYLDGEARAHAWADEVASRLEREGSARIPFAKLADAASGGTQLVDQVWFVDSARRRGDTLTTRPLGSVAGLLALLRNTFLGAGDSRAWTQQLRTVRRLADALSLFEISAPQGLSALASGARSYVTNSAS